MEIVFRACIVHGPSIEVQSDIQLVPLFVASAFVHLDVVGVKHLFSVLNI